MFPHRVLHSQLLLVVQCLLLEFAVSLGKYLAFLILFGQDFVERSYLDSYSFEAAFVLPYHLIIRNTLLNLLVRQAELKPQLFICQLQLLYGIYVFLRSSFHQLSPIPLVDQFVLNEPGAGDKGDIVLRERGVRRMVGLERPLHTRNPLGGGFPVLGLHGWLPAPGLPRWFPFSGLHGRLCD